MQDSRVWLKFSLYRSRYKRSSGGIRVGNADEMGIYFTTFTIVDWLVVFIRDSYRIQIVEDLNYCIAHKGLEVYSWCLMSSHLHMIIAAKDGYGISDIIRDFKKHTAKAILHKIQTEPESRSDDFLWHFERAGKYDSRITTYKFWQEDNHAIHIDPMRTDILKQKMDYIHDNPVKEGWVQYAHEYLYSSAKDYAGQPGLVKIQFV